MRARVVGPVGYRAATRGAAGAGSALCTGRLGVCPDCDAGEEEASEPGECNGEADVAGLTGKSGEEAGEAGEEAGVTDEADESGEEPDEASKGVGEADGSGTKGKGPCAARRQVELGKARSSPTGGATNYSCAKGK